MAKASQNQTSSRVPLNTELPESALTCCEGGQLVITVCSIRLQMAMVVSQRYVFRHQGSVMCIYGRFRNYEDPNMDPKLP